MTKTSESENEERSHSYFVRSCLPYCLMVLSQEIAGTDRALCFCGLLVPLGYVCTQLCLTLCDPMDCSPPGSCVHEFYRREYWSGCPFSSPGDLPHSGIELASLASPALAAGFFTIAPPGKPHVPLKRV